MPEEGEDFSAAGDGGLRLPPGYFMQYVSVVPGRGAGRWILRDPDGAAVTGYAAGTATRGAVEEAAAEHRRARGRCRSVSPRRRLAAARGPGVGRWEGDLPPGYGVREGAASVLVLLRPGGSEVAVFVARAVDPFEVIAAAWEDYE